MLHSISVVFSLALFSLVWFTGCTDKASPIPDAQRYFTFPVILTEMNAADNQAQLEARFIARVAMQTRYAQCAVDKPQPECVVIVPAPAPQRYGIKGLTMRYYKAGLLHLRAEYPVVMESTQSGRAFTLTIKPTTSLLSGSGAMVMDAWQISEPRPMPVSYHD